MNQSRWSLIEQIGCSSLFAVSYPARRACKGREFQARGKGAGGGGGTLQMLDHQIFIDDVRGLRLGVRRTKLPVIYSN